jgi:hypothetical protein
MRLELLLRGVLLALALLVSGSFHAGAGERLAIKGYDPVAYFTVGKPTPGSPEHEVVWRDARWRFSSAQHRELFAKNPEMYAPQYGGYCAMGVALGMKAEVDPQVWRIVDGRLFLNYDRSAQKKWEAERTAMIETADAKWKALAAEN